MLVNDILRQVQAVPATLTSHAVLNLFEADDGLEALPVVNAEGFPIALINRNQFVGKLVRPFYREIYLPHSCLKLADCHPLILEADTPLLEASFRVLEAGGKAVHNGFVIVRDGQFAGIGSAQDMLKLIADIHAKRSEELAEAKAAADSASLSKSRFLATMSHEIRTPLNGIMGMAQILMMSDIDESDRTEYAKTILGSAQILLTLLNDILDFSKIEAGRIELERVAFSPAELLHEIENLFIGSANSKGLVLNVSSRITPEKLYWGDPMRLRQVLSNLISNGIKFTSSGSISVHADLPRQGWLRFTVSDTGIGIPEDRLHVLFESFSQVDSSISRRYGGTGLGLAISKNLVELMGGTIGVTSQAGEGSVFWLEIPAENIPVSGAMHQEDRLLSGQSYAALGSHPAANLPLILVVEDKPSNSVVMAAMMRQIGYPCQIVENGLQALDAWENAITPFGLILMDCHMPEMDGYQATERLRAMEKTSGKPRVPVIAVTAEVFEENRNRCFAVGMDGFLTKPLILSELKAVLTQWLSGPPGSDERAFTSASIS